MSRSRVAVASALSIAGLGVALGLAAFLLAPARGAAGLLPAEALALPADTRLLLGVEVPKLVASPLYRHLDPGRIGALRRLRDTLGIDPERDLDRLFLAGGGGADDAAWKGQGVVIAVGRFDRRRLGPDASKAGTGPGPGDGKVLHLFDQETKQGRLSIGAGFLDQRTLAVGSAPLVEAMLASHAAGRTPLASNRQLVELLRRVEPGAAFWMVGDRTLLAEVSRVLGSGGSSLPANLPPLESLVVSGRLAPDLTVRATGEAQDEATARSLAGMARGLVAFLSLQASRTPELQQVASAVSVTTEAKAVHVDARIPYVLLDALAPAADAASDQR
jgi:hypothetical protein